ncbi:MAG: DNA alkylation repair protein [Bacteroidota bacterium]
MPKPLKYLYSEDYLQTLAAALQKVVPKVESATFLKAVFTPEWDTLELKERMYHIRSILAQYLDADFAKAAPQLLALTEALRKGPLAQASLEGMYLPDYIEKHGLAYPKLAAQLFEQITSYTSCEFAVRPFILQDQEGMLAQMLEWTQHESEHVRRLASEGSRPRLPWAMALPPLKKDPRPLLPILTKLKEDASEYVRRSVANNFNDIAKDHPDVVLQTFSAWNHQSALTDRIIKHGSRTLLKQGHPEALALFGYSALDELEVSAFALSTKVVQVGEYLPYEFILQNKANKPALIRLECGVYYLKANGQHNRKVFKIAEREMKADTTEHIERQQHFKPISTRKYYPGPHALAIILNGVEVAKLEFDLLT